jgi:pimeloyl-ACP methyl ester carboxylesterase
VARSELEPAQREEIEDLWERLRRAPDPDYERFEGVDPAAVEHGMVGPDHFGSFPEDGHVVLEAHGTLSGPEFFENLNTRLERSPRDFRPYAIDTPAFAPTVDDYAEELERAFRALQAADGTESFSVVAHSLGGVGTLKWLHDYDRYDEVEMFIPVGSPFHGSAAADLAAKVDERIDAIEMWWKSATLFNPFVPSRRVEEFFRHYRLGELTDDFVTRRSAEEGPLAELMRETTVTEAAEVYTVRSSIDRFYIDPKKTLSRGLEHLAALSSWENRIDSPEIPGAEANFVLPSSTHHEIMTGELAVEYIARALEGYREEPGRGLVERETTESGQPAD